AAVLVRGRPARGGPWAPTEGRRHPRRLPVRPALGARRPGGKSVSDCREGPSRRAGDRGEDGRGDRTGSPDRGRLPEFLRYPAIRVHPADHPRRRSLPFNLLMMFVHGYQSFLFNRTLSERMRRRMPIHEPVAGDLVLPADASGLPDRSRTIDVTCDNLERAAKRCREGKAWVSAILFGSEPEFAGGEPGQIEKTIVASEGLRPEDFIIPEIPRISSKGTRREILAPFRGLDVQVGEAAFSLSFELTRGSYATCLVREFTKSE